MTFAARIIYSVFADHWYGHHIIEEVEGIVESWIRKLDEGNHETSEYN